jgi:hypothetical protein
VLTPDVVAKAEQYLREGQNARDVASDLGIKWDTFRKAMNSGRINVEKKRGES